MSLRRLMGGAAIVALASVCAVEAQAQETSGDIRGQIVDGSGAPVADASVVIIHVPSNTASATTTDASGGFSARGLRVGGPYSVTVTKSGFAPQQLDGVVVDLGQTTRVNLSLQSGAVDTVVVTASVANTAQLAIGPSASFSLDDLQTDPAINRDLKDIVRMDPRVYLDESFSDAIQCAGAHPRFNSLTVDGVTLSDGFGLNSNGYPTERMPFPYDAISNVSVELAPFDVQYGGFSACNINAVTKSGGNEFHGSLFFDYTDDSLRGDTIEGQKVFVAPFEEKRYGASVGGPIIQDKLFFFAAYEKFEGVNQFFRGPAGSGAVNIINGLSQSDYDRIVQIANTVYGYDPGGTPSPSPAEDEKYVVRLDWNISSQHRAAFTYNYNTGLNRTESDSNQSNQFEFEKHLYNRGADPLEAYALQLFSDWTDNFSTEARLGYNDVSFVQQCLDGGNVGEVQVRLASATVFLGCDDSRHANQLNYTVLSGKLAGTFRVNNAAITAGYEYQKTDVFNQFVQATEGQFIFTGGTNTQVLDNFANGTPSQVVYANARGTNNPADAAAQFAYTVHTGYLQYEFSPLEAVDVTMGLRYDYYQNDDEPNFNQFFLARNGFANTYNLDGLGLTQPRFGLTWDATDDIKVRAGAGLFSGGNPNVWISNSYSNDGLTALRFTNNSPGNILTSPNVGDERTNPTVNPGGALWGVPQSLFNQVASGSANSTVNAIDPNFDAPSAWKYSLGATVFLDVPKLGSDYVLDVDYLHVDSKDAAIIKDLQLEQIGQTPDGQPIYRRIDRSDPDCAVDPASAACSQRPSGTNDLLLTNAEDGGEQDVYSISVRKSYDDIGIDWSAAYAYVDATDASSMTSSVAFSNWTSIAVADINNPGVAVSNYEIPHRFTGSLTWKHAFFGDYLTKASLFAQHFQGRPYSFVFSGTNAVGPSQVDGIFGDSNQGIHLAYIPTGIDDPAVIFCNGAPTPGYTTANDPCATRNASTGAVTGYGNFNSAAFFAYTDYYGLQRGATSGRNAYDGQWTTKFDLKLEQEFPTYYGRGAGYVVIENLGNLLNDEWGTFYQAAFPERTAIVDANYDPATNRYAYKTFSALTPATGALNKPESRVGDVSFWTIRLGVRYEF